jgi:hypothetical protein
MATKTIEELEKELKALQAKPKDTTNPLDFEAFPITAEEKARYTQSHCADTLEGFTKAVRQIYLFMENILGKGNRFGTVNGQICVLDPNGEVVG